MKSILLIISFLFLTLFGIKSVNNVPFQEERDEYACLVSNGSIHSCNAYDFILPETSELPEDGMAITDAQSLARQLRGCGRTHRTLNYLPSLSKMLAWKTLWNRMEILSQVSLQSYNSLPCPSWALPSEHYVYAMRRILI